MGIVPIWGFQLAVAISLSFLLRLNKALVIIAANISIPPMLPFILFLSHLAGALWMGKDAQYISFSSDMTFDLIQASFFQYVVGAVTLAIIAGVIFGVVTYGILKLTRRNKARNKNRSSVR